ncbi:GNAT family N-acetyltransferase [Longimicrobium sp.]|jgi:GNAT superfamily N-acetyltransferase|uniref:GNAT family N-acetyltransferase n=1 Tax=Longimicrobium sp. TaxID=2029185 RepID=UPI002F92A8EE
MDVYESSGNVFADLGLPDAEERYARAMLSRAIVKEIEARGTTAAMDLAISVESIASLDGYASIPIAFEVASAFEVCREGDRFVLSEESVSPPYIKDYDAIPGEHPAGWAERFDVSKWGVLAARVGGRRVGGAVIAFDTPGLDMLEGRRDLAVLWDIRVAPEARGKGVGAALFHAAEAWARARGCRHIKVETQNVNVPACRFYARQGCVLTTVDPSAYPGLPGEVQLLWYKDLGPAPNT